MSNTVTVALLSLIGTLIGSLGGIVASGKLTAFRLSALEKKVDEYGKLIQRLPIIEKEQQNIERRIQGFEAHNDSRIFPS